MNSFNKTKAAIFLCRHCFLRAFPFISLILLTTVGNESESKRDLQATYLDLDETGRLPKKSLVLSNKVVNGYNYLPETAFFPDSDFAIRKW